MSSSETAKFAAYRRSLRATAEAAHIDDCWISRDNLKQPATVMCTATELGALRLEHRFCKAKTAMAHQSLFEGQDDLWIFSISLDELERLFKKGV